MRKIRGRGILYGGRRWSDFCDERGLEREWVEVHDAYELDVPGIGRLRVSKARLKRGIKACRRSIICAVCDRLVPKGEGAVRFLNGFYHRAHVECSDSTPPPAMCRYLGLPQTDVPEHLPPDESSQPNKHLTTTQGSRWAALMVEAIRLGKPPHSDCECQICFVSKGGPREDSAARVRFQRIANDSILLAHMLSVAAIGHAGATEKLIPLRGIGWRTAADRRGLS